ncbi:MAG TPA: tetratricopeptide repeat protein [Chthoniobacterales bacterium]|nr:tetratricopeptide repeat protein [Chthoniobacterales bacterium]
MAENFRHFLFADGFSNHYRPIQSVSFVFDYLVSKNDTLGFHLTNVFLHVGSAMLLYFLLRRLLPLLLSRGEWPRRESFQAATALLVALVWVVHPVHSAAVDYISGRADSLAFLFAAGGWLLFLRGSEDSRRNVRGVLYLLAAISGEMSLLSREIALIWLLLFVGYLVFLARKLNGKQRVSALLCCLVLAAAYLSLRQLPEVRSGPAPHSSWSLDTRATLMVRAMGDYARLMFWPANLHMERSVFGDERSANAGELAALALGGGLLFVSSAYGCWRSGRGRRLRIFGAAWFFFAILPVSNLFELNATVAEHWLYLPSVGFLLFLAGWVAELSERQQRFALLIVCAGIFAASGRGFVRSGDWAEPETFYRRTLAAGGNSFRLRTNLAQIFRRRGDTEKAKTEYREMLRATPDYPPGRTALAQILAAEGKTAEAESLLRTGTEAAQKSNSVYPRTWALALNLARLQQSRGDLPGALETLRHTTGESAPVWEVIDLEAELLEDLNGPRAAIPQVEEFVRLHWWHHDALLALGRLFGETGEIDRSVEFLRRASRVDVWETDALNLLVIVLARHHRLAEACAVQQQAIARHPDDPQPYLVLSELLQRGGRVEEARAAIAEFNRLRIALRTDRPKA